ncbi:MAG TPA: IS5 family transposase [Candidatus Saccharimonadales bacterium]|nr:IS5 family transposase [Candidatus Saccharimonadales bacterium]
MKFKKGQAQGGLFDYHERREALSEKATPLDRLNEHIDWELFRADLEGHLAYKSGSQGGAYPWCPVLMFKVVVLQKYYELSEEQTEFQILDRFSFQRFLGLDVGDDVPDKNTIWNFKERLGQKGLEGCFALFDEVLRAEGLLAHRGKIVDASFVEVPRQRNSREENAQIKHGQTPEDWKNQPAKLAQKDVDARWTIKKQERFYGYKNHIKCNARTKLIEDYTVTPANVHDSQPLVGLLTKEDGRLHGDCAYRSVKVDEELQKRGIINCLHEKSHRDHPLTKRQEQTNTKRSRIRARVEHIFGFQVQQMRANWIRTIGLKRAKRSIGLGNLVYNLFRYVQLGGSMT